MNNKDKKPVIFGVRGLTFSNQEVDEAVSAGSPLTVDIAIPSGCRNRCIYCGWADKPEGKGLSQQEIFDFFKDFAGIGGKSARVLGRGEPTLRKDILNIFDFMNKVDVIPVIFSCGDVIGDDDYCRQVHGMDGTALLRELKDRDVSIILKYERTDEDEITGVEGYSEKRNLALERILNAGFNEFSPSRIGVASVILADNLDELPEIYEKGLENNVYSFFCPLMPTGKVRDRSYRERIGISQEKMIDLAVKLHITAFQHGIEYSGPSDFPGTLPCFITKAGFYMNDTGDIHLCVPDDFHANIRDKRLSEIWKDLTQKKKIKYEKHGLHLQNGECLPKRIAGVIPFDYNEQVDKRVMEYIKDHPGEFGSKGNFNYVIK